MTIYEQRRFDKAVSLLKEIYQYENNFFAQASQGNGNQVRYYLSDYNENHKTRLEFAQGSFRYVIINKKDRYVIKFDKDPDREWGGCRHEKQNYDKFAKEYPDLLKYLVKPILGEFMGCCFSVMPFVADAGACDSTLFYKKRKVETTDINFSRLTDLFDDLHFGNWGFAYWDRSRVKIFDYAL